MLITFIDLNEKRDNIFFLLQKYIFIYIRCTIYEAIHRERKKNFTTSLMYGAAYIVRRIIRQKKLHSV